MLLKEATWNAEGAQDEINQVHNCYLIELMILRDIGVCVIEWSIRGRM